jgi:hypothetical protein
MKHPLLPHSRITSIASVVIWLGSAQLALCFYNPSTGRWLSRDRAEEEEATGVYTPVHNCGVGNIDFLGNKTLTVGFAFDSSARATPDTMATISRGLGFLQRMLIFCVQQTDCGCQQTDRPAIGVRALYDYTTPISAPNDGIYDLDTPQGKALSIINRLIAHLALPDSAPFVVTRSTIAETWTGRRLNPAAITEPGLGTLYNVNWRNAFIIAHELGHFADYRGDADGDPFHSADSNNLMYIHGGNVPDCQWCQKMDALAK